LWVHPDGGDRAIATAKFIAISADTVHCNNNIIMLF
jgi:hypothetical protein